MAPRAGGRRGSTPLRRSARSSLLPAGHRAALGGYSTEFAVSAATMPGRPQIDGAAHASHVWAESPMTGSIQRKATAHAKGSDAMIPPVQPQLAIERPQRRKYERRPMPAQTDAAIAFVTQKPRHPSLGERDPAPVDTESQATGHDDVPVPVGIHGMRIVRRAAGRAGGSVTRRHGHAHAGVRLCEAGARSVLRHQSMAASGKRGAGEGNRTLVVSLGSFCSTIELHPRRSCNCQRLRGIVARRCADHRRRRFSGALARLARPDPRTVPS